MKNYRFKIEIDTWVAHVPPYYDPDGTRFYKAFVLDRDQCGAVVFESQPSTERNDAWEEACDYVKETSHARSGASALL